MLHQLKLESEYFEQKIKGIKPWEVRLNDRHYEVGDYLAENETIGGAETGRFTIEKIVSIISSDDFVGLQPDYVILSTVPHWLGSGGLNYHVYGENNRAAEKQEDE